MEQSSEWLAGEVGTYYDDGGADWFATVMGDNSHVGYWPDGDRTASLQDATDNLTDLVAGRLSLRRGDRLLDLGCGVGRPAVRVARASGADVTGVAISGRQVGRAAELSEREGVCERVRFQEADAMRLPFADGEFDAVLALESVMHMPSRATAFAEAARVLRPGGRFALTDMFERSPVAEHRRPVLDRCLGMMFATLADLADYPALCRATGLRLVELADITDRSWAPSHVEVARIVEGRRDEMTERFGAAFTERSDTMMADVAGVTEIGYALVVAERVEGGAR